MKAFLATLLIVGLAAALPSPKSIIENLKTQLQEDVEEIKTHTKQMDQQLKEHTLEDMEAISQDPYDGLRVVINNLHKDAKNVIGTYSSDANNVQEHVQYALDELKKVDAAPLMDILQKLKQQLNGDAKDVQATVQQLVKQALAHVGDDVKALLVDPSSAANIVQDNYNTDHRQFVSEAQKYVATVQQQVQDAIQKLNQQIEQ